jgi:hypothetical protein
MEPFVESWGPFGVLVVAPWGHKTLAKLGAEAYGSAGHPVKAVGSEAIKKNWKSSGPS